LTPEILKDALKVRNAQIKRFQAMARDADVDDLTVILARVSSNDIASFIAKIRTINGVTKVNVASRHSGEAERSPD
jgi:putative Mg2+ transporter-C (MgtC) family protein